MFKIVPTHLNAYRNVLYYSGFHFPLELCCVFLSRDTVMWQFAHFIVNMFLGESSDIVYSALSPQLMHMCSIFLICLKPQS